MIHEPRDPDFHSAEAEQQAVDEVVSGGPAGAVAVAGVAVLIVFAIWFAFYLFVFVPRG